LHAHTALYPNFYSHISLKRGRTSPFSKRSSKPSIARSDQIVDLKATWGFETEESGCKWPSMQVRVPDVKIFLQLLFFFVGAIFKGFEGHGSPRETAEKAQKKVSPQSKKVNFDSSFVFSFESEATLIFVFLRPSRRRPSMGSQLAPSWLAELLEGRKNTKMSSNCNPIGFGSPRKVPHFEIRPERLGSNL